MEVNYLAVIAAGVAAWMIGSLWYSPLLFSKAWQKELGFTDEYLKQGNMPLIFGSSLILMIIMAFGLNFIIQMHPEITWSHGFFHGCMVGLFYCATSMGITYLYQRKSIKLYLIDAVYQVLMLGVAGIVLAVWP